MKHLTYITVAANLLKDEGASTPLIPTTTTEEEGVLNTFLIEGVSTMFREALAAKQQMLKGNLFENHRLRCIVVVTSSL